MTYKELYNALNSLTENQLQQFVTVELGLSDECLPAQLRIAGKEHDTLDENHPIIYVIDG